MTETENMVDLRGDRIREVLQWAHTQFLDPRWHLLQAAGGTVAAVLEAWVLAPVRVAMRSDGTPLLLTETWDALQRNMKVDFGMLYDRLNTAEWATHLRRMKMLVYDVQDSATVHPSGGFYWNPKASAIVVTRSGVTPPSVRECYRVLGYAGGTHPDVSHPPPTPPPAENGEEEGDEA